MAKFESYKGRTVEQGQIVKVYRNLHKDTFSIVDVKSGLVLGYSRTVRLQAATFKVSEAGRQRVLRDKQKNVHAYVVGTFVGTLEAFQRHEAYYNPFKVKTFVTSAGVELHKAASVTLRDSKVYYTGRE